MATGCNTTSISTNGDGAVYAAVAADCTMTSNDACLDNVENGIIVPSSDAMICTHTTPVVVAASRAIAVMRGGI